jgi:cyclophilin family peptidyl-prolyl cis-trans isomerase
MKLARSASPAIVPSPQLDTPRPAAAARPEHRSDAFHAPPAAPVALHGVSHETSGLGLNGSSGTLRTATGRIRAEEWSNPAAVVGRLTQNPAGGATENAAARCGPSSLLGASLMQGPESGARFLTSVASGPAGARLGFVRSLPIQTQPDAAFALTGDGKVHGWGVYCPGVAGMARDEGNDTANSQFFLMRQAYPALDKRYTVWGMTVSGLDVVRSLRVGEGANGMVTGEPDRMTRVRVAADIAAAERPAVRVMATDTPRFRAMVDALRVSRGADFSVCDVNLPVEVTN